MSDFPRCWGGPLDLAEAPLTLRNYFGNISFPWPGGWYCWDDACRIYRWYEKPGAYTREDHRNWCRIYNLATPYPTRYRGCEA